MRKKFGRLKSINKANLKKLMDGPGVYGIFDKKGKLLKIGRAKRNRPAERITESSTKIQKAKKFSFIKTGKVQDAIKLETKMIKQRKPPYNKEMKGK